MTTQHATDGQGAGQNSRAEDLRLQSEPTISERMTGKAVSFGENLGAGGGTLPRIEGLLGSVT